MNILNILDFSGMGTVYDIESMETGENDRPKKDVIVKNCGEITREELEKIAVENDGTEDTFPHHPDDLDLDWNLQSNFSQILDIIGKIKNAGNTFYKVKDTKNAVRKYKKAAKYIDHLRQSMGGTEDEEEEEIRKVEVPIGNFKKIVNICLLFFFLHFNNFYGK